MHAVTLVSSVLDVARHSAMAFTPARMYKKEKVEVGPVIKT